MEKGCDLPWIALRWRVHLGPWQRRQCLRLKKRKGNFGIIGLLRNLGHIQSKLDRVLDGLASKPMSRRKRLGFLGLSIGTGGREFVYILEAGSDFFWLQK
jgi:hypothetical protein